MIRLAFLLLVLAALSACGNKGPLVMPGPAPAPAPVAEPAAIDPAQPPVGTESDSDAPIPR